MEKESSNKKQLRCRNEKVAVIVITVILIVSMLLIFLNNKIGNVGKDVTDKADTIHQIIKEDRMSVNDQIISLGKEYDTYKMEAEESLGAIRQDLVLVSDGTSMDFETIKNDFARFNENYNSFVQNMDSQIVFIQSEMETKTVNEEFEAFLKSYEEYKKNTAKTVADLTDELENLDSKKADEDSLILLTESYNSFVQNMDSQIEVLQSEMNTKISNKEFEKFIKSYEEYKENTSEMIANLDSKKADKDSVALLTKKLESLESSYQAFVGENGAFETLVLRVSEQENISENNKAAIEELEDRIVQLETKMAGEHPVGSIYISVTNENPAELYGGEWERIEDTFLMCAGEKYLAGSEGGNNQVLLSDNQIPSLNIAGQTEEKNDITTGTSGSHNHTLSTNAVNGAGSTSVDGNHSHVLDMGNHGVPLEYHDGDHYGDIFYYERGSSTYAAGDHSHTLNIPSLSGYTDVTGNHSHVLNLPALNVVGSFLNENQQQIDVTNKYLSVYVWKRVA